MLLFLSLNIDRPHKTVHAIHPLLIHYLGCNPSDISNHDPNYCKIHYRLWNQSLFLFLKKICSSKTLKFLPELIFYTFFSHKFCPFVIIPGSRNNSSKGLIIVIIIAQSTAIPSHHHLCVINRLSLNQANETGGLDMYTHSIHISQ